ncbi:MAG TPA: cupin domain-containing protein [Actinomycetota bacterium]|nr:cupin domain-containing protein [Actinomycetota bacterium]
MGKLSETEASDHLEGPGYEGHIGEIEGTTVSFETYTEDADLSPFFAGLPNDHCQCPHWGTVLRGKLTYRYEDGSTDVISTGEAYYARPGHVPVLTAGTEVIEFSPSVELAKTIEVVTRNVEAASTSA